MVASMVLPQIPVKDLLALLVFQVLVVPQALPELLGLPVLLVLRVLPVAEALMAVELGICVPALSFHTT